MQRRRFPNGSILAALLALSLAALGACTDVKHSEPLPSPLSTPSGALDSLIGALESGNKSAVLGHWLWESNRETADAFFSYHGSLAMRDFASYLRGAKIQSSDPSRVIYTASATIGGINETLVLELRLANDGRWGVWDLR